MAIDPLTFSELLPHARAQFVAAIDYERGMGVLDLKDKDKFIQILRAAVDTCKLDQNDLSELFETSHTTISRWMNGKTLPHPPYREPIILKLRDRVEEVMQQEEEIAL